MRIGYGEDTHRFAAGRRLILGGVEITYAPDGIPMGLLGHSDADVLTHALIDALLGAMCLGDIGTLFPDTDPAYAGADSLKLLAQVKEELRAREYGIAHMDATVIAQRPKLAPYRKEMRANLARTLGCDLHRVSVKASTTEGCGPEGRGECISARCVCLIEKRVVLAQSMD